jgi:hypothetical protein
METNSGYRALDRFQEVGQRNFETTGEGFHDPKAHILVPVFHLRDEDPADAGLLREVFLRPAVLRP